MASNDRTPKPAAARPKRRSLREALAGRKADKVEEHRQAKSQTLRALQQTPKHVYAGTVPGHVVDKRRAANKAARKARRANRTH